MGFGWFGHAVLGLYAGGVGFVVSGGFIVRCSARVLFCWVDFGLLDCAGLVVCLPYYGYCGVGII